jgi:hypothetical protein
MAKMTEDRSVWLAQPDSQGLAAVIETFGEIDGDDAIRVSDHHGLAIREARDQVEPQATHVRVPRRDRQTQVAQLEEKPTLRLLRLGELLQGHRVVGRRTSPSQSTRETATRRRVLADQPIARPLAIRAGIPGLVIDADTALPQAIELSRHDVVAEIGFAIRTRERVEIDEVPAVWAAGLGAHALTVALSHLAADRFSRSRHDRKTQQDVVRLPG